MPMTIILGLLLTAMAQAQSLIDVSCHGQDRSGQAIEVNFQQGEFIYLDQVPIPLDITRKRIVAGVLVIVGVSRQRGQQASLVWNFSQGSSSASFTIRSSTPRGHQETTIPMSCRGL